MQVFIMNLVKSLLQKGLQNFIFSLNLMRSIGWVFYPLISSARPTQIIAFTGGTSGSRDQTPSNWSLGRCNPSGDAKSYSNWQIQCPLDDVLSIHMHSCLIYILVCAYIIVALNLMHAEAILEKSPTWSHPSTIYRKAVSGVFHSFPNVYDFTFNLMNSVINPLQTLQMTA